MVIGAEYLFRTTPSHFESLSGRVGLSLHFPVAVIEQFGLISSILSQSLTTETKCDVDAPHSYRNCSIPAVAELLGWWEREVQVKLVLRLSFVFSC